MKTCMQCGAILDLCDTCSEPLTTNQKIMCYTEEHICMDCEEMTYAPGEGIETEVVEDEKE